MNPPLPGHLQAVVDDLIAAARRDLAGRPRRRRRRSLLIALAALVPAGLAAASISGGPLHDLFATVQEADGPALDSLSFPVGRTDSEALAGAPSVLGPDDFDDLGIITTPLRLRDGARLDVCRVPVNGRGVKCHAVRGGWPIDGTTHPMTIPPGIHRYRSKPRLGVNPDAPGLSVYMADRKIFIELDANTGLAATLDCPGPPPGTTETPEQAGARVDACGRELDTDAVLRADIKRLTETAP